MASSFCYCKQEQCYQSNQDPHSLNAMRISRVCGGRVRESGRFLGLGVTYKSLAKWAKANENPGRYDAQSPSHSTT